MYGVEYISQRKVDLGLRRIKLKCRFLRCSQAEARNQKGKYK